VTLDRDKAAKAERVRVEIEMAAGKLDVQGGAAGLLDAGFTYNVPVFKPEVRYDDTSFRGKLTLRQGGSHTGSLGNLVNEWNLKLGDGIPLELIVHCGAGENRLDLRELTLRRVEVHMGAGQVDLDLRGKPQRDFEAQVHGGVGQATVLVPEDTGVVAEASGGIGSVHVSGMRKDGGQWVNDAYGKSKTTIRLEVRGGIGEINIRAGG
jgi:hypothetical protein